MRLNDCELNLKAIMAAPVIRIEPSEPWREAYEEKLIPENLYRFYVVANFFSLDACPNFLRDDENILFAHVEAAAEVVRESFVESIEMFELLRDFNEKSYNPVKHGYKGKSEDQKQAEKNFRRYLQMVFITLYSILDSMAEIIAAILSCGTVGSAYFSQLITKDKSVKQRKEVKETITNINEPFIEDIKDVINKKMYIEECSKDWFEIFKLYRNKLAHFKISGMLNFPDKKGDYHAFLPRVWPNYIQQHLSYSSKQEKCKIGNQSTIELAMEEDVFDYLNGLRKTLFNLVDDIFGVTLKAYELKKKTNCGLVSTRVCIFIANLILFSPFSRPRPTLWLA